MYIEAYKYPPLHIPNMSEGMTFESRACPECGEETDLVHLGWEKPREVCGRFSCDWEGKTIKSI